MSASQRVLLLVDLQNDFCTGGALAVPEGEAVIPIANDLQPYFDLVVATQDWHPRDHVSFAANYPDGVVGAIKQINQQAQVLWPVHCVQNTHGAALHPALRQDLIKKIVHKGTDKHIDSYSAFFDNAHAKETVLAGYLYAQNIKQVYVLGLATDYCVQYSVLDALRLGFKVVLITDACRGVDLHPGDVEKALNAMQAAGAILKTADEVKQMLAR